MPGKVLRYLVAPGDTRSRWSGLGCRRSHEDGDADGELRMASPAALCAEVTATTLRRALCWSLLRRRGAREHPRRLIARSMMAGCSLLSTPEAVPLPDAKGR